MGKVKRLDRRGGKLNGAWRLLLGASNTVDTFETSAREGFSRAHRRTTAVG